MIHINERSKQLAPLSSTMCSRRHKGMVQTSFILVLIVCIGYGFYLYNLLQVKVKYLDTKALHHQSQQQSLSSQLQGVYEDRARLEKAVQKSKTEMQNMKAEKESMIQSMLIEHQDQNQALDKENKEMKEKNKALVADNQNLKSRHDRIYKDHDELKKKHQNALNEHADSFNEVNVELQKYNHENEALRKLRDGLEYQVRQNKEEMTLIMSEKAQAAAAAENAESLLNDKTREVSQLRKQNEQHQKDEAALMQESEYVKRMYLSLQTLLKGIPVNAINFDHPDIRSLDANDKRLLTDHLGGGKGDFGLQNRHDMAQHNQVDEDLNDPEKRYGQEQISEKNGMVANHFQPKVRSDKADINLDGNIHDVQPGNVIQEPERPDENEIVNEQNQPHDAAVRQDAEQDRLLKEEELKAKKQEEAAKLELEKQKQEMLLQNPDRKEEDHLQKLRENSKLQLELAQDQRSDMEKIIDKQWRDEQEHAEIQIETDVEDDNNDRDGGGYKDANKEVEYEDQGNNDDGNGEDFAIDNNHLVEKGDDVQVAVPPAAQVAGHDPEAVMNSPPAKHDGVDSHEINRQNAYRGHEQEDERNDGLVYEDDNQQEEGDAGVDENGNPEEEKKEEDNGRQQLYRRR